MLPSLRDVFDDEARKRDLFTKLRAAIEQGLRDGGVTFTVESPTKIYAHRTHIDDLLARGTNADPPALDGWVDDIARAVVRDVRLRKIRAVDIQDMIKVELGRNLGEKGVKPEYILVCSFLY